MRSITEDHHYESVSAGGAATATLQSLDDIRPLTCFLTEKDRAGLAAQLRSIAGCRDGIFPQLARYLEAKLADARPLAEGAVPADLATGGSRVVYALDDTRHPEDRILVQSAEDFVVGLTLPTTSLLGAALLGGVAGQQVPYLTAEGDLRYAELREVAYQPEAASCQAAERRAG